MSKKKILILILSLVVVATVALAIVFRNDVKTLFTNNDKESLSQTETVNKKEKDILSFSAKEEISSFIEQNDIESFEEDNCCYLLGTEVFEMDSDAIITYDGDYVKYINVDFLLYERTYSDTELENIPEDGFTAEAFSKEEIKKIEDAFSSFKKKFENYINSDELTVYDVISTGDTSVQNDEEGFYKGKTVKQYSIRDKNGTLWILNFSASHGSSIASLRKVLEESDYSGFIPNIDMTE